MVRYPKPTEGSWTRHYPHLGTRPVSYDDSISPEFYEPEREAIFKRAWLHVGRIEQIPRMQLFHEGDRRRRHFDNPRARRRGRTGLP